MRLRLHFYIIESNLVFFWNLQQKVGKLQYIVEALKRICFPVIKIIFICSVLHVHFYGFIMLLTFNLF